MNYFKFNEKLENLALVAEQKAKEMLLTPAEVCEQLKISDVTLWRWSKAEYLTPLYIGGKRRYKASDVQALIEKGGARC